MAGDEPHYLGHRKRLRERFLAGGKGALAEYELLELLLGYSIPRKDTKPLAKRLIEEAGSFAAVFDLDPEKLREIGGVGENTAALLRLVRTCTNRYLEPAARTSPVLDSPDKAIDYIRSEIGHEPRECFMVLCLDSAGRLAHHEIVSVGTVNQAHVYPREVLRTAITHGAAALILVHNHPSGSPRPSAHDRKLTRDISELGSALGITIHDHLVITRDTGFSIRLGRAVG